MPGRVQRLTLPLPAASWPSNAATSRAPSARIHSCMVTSSRACCPRIGGIERLSTPRPRLQQSEQLGERAESFLRDGLDLLLGDRIQSEFVHLPAALALSEDLPPRSGRRSRLASQNLLGAGVHTPAAFRVVGPGRVPPRSGEWRRRRGSCRRAPLAATWPDGRRPAWVAGRRPSGRC